MLSPLVFVVLQTKPLRTLAERNAAAFRSAILHHDATWFERTLAPAFAQRTEEARLDRRTALAQIEKGLLKMKATSLTQKVTSVRPEGKGYVATIAWHGTLPAKIGERAAVLNVTWEDEQHWKPTAGRWLLQSLTTSHFERVIE